MKPDNPPLPKGHQSLTGLNSVQGVNVPIAANWAMIRVTGGDVRWTDDGSTPTASNGYPLLDTEELTYDAVTGLPGLQFFATAGTPIVSLAYYGV